MNNGFDEYKISILNGIDELKNGQKDTIKKLDELKTMVITKFGKMETSIAIIKTRVAMYAVIFGGVASVLINVGIALFKYA